MDQPQPLEEPHNPESESVSVSVSSTRSPERTYGSVRKEEGEKGKEGESSLLSRGGAPEGIHSGVPNSVQSSSITATHPTELVGANSSATPSMLSFLTEHHHFNLPNSQNINTPNDQSSSTAHWPTAVPLYRPGAHQKQLYNFIGAPSPMSDQEAQYQQDISLQQQQHQQFAHHFAQLEAFQTHSMSDANAQNLPPPKPSRKHARGKSMDATLSQGENKQRHNDSERRRRNKINQLLEELRTIVPNCKMNKSAILEATTEYINKLKMQSAQLAALNRDLEQENAEMLGFIAKAPPPLPNLGNSSFNFPLPPGVPGSSAFLQLAAMDLSGSVERNGMDDASGRKPKADEFAG